MHEFHQLNTAAQEFQHLQKRGKSSFTLERKYMWCRIKENTKRRTRKDTSMPRCPLALFRSNVQMHHLYAYNIGALLVKRCMSKSDWTTFRAGWISLKRVTPMRISGRRFFYSLLAEQSQEIFGKMNIGGLWSIA